QVLNQVSNVAAPGHAQRGDCAALPIVLLKQGQERLRGAVRVGFTHAVDDDDSLERRAVALAELVLQHFRQHELRLDLAPQFVERVAPLRWDKYWTIDQPALIACEAQQPRDLRLADVEQAGDDVLRDVAGLAERVGGAKDLRGLLEIERA